MRKWLAALAAVTVLGHGALARAQGPKPFQLSLFNPAQLFPENASVEGLRFNLVYGKNANVSGLDVGVANHVTGQFWGLQWAMLANITDGTMRGLQGGAFNQSTAARGVQIGFVNVAKQYHGFQMGFFNMTDGMHGLQIGLINVIREKRELPVLPIVNWNF